MSQSNRRALLANFYDKGYVPPGFGFRTWRQLEVPPGSGDFILEASTAPGFDEALRYVYFRARYTPPGTTGQITMYFWLMRKQKNVRPQNADFALSCDIHSYSGASVPAYAEEVFLDCMFFSAEALFAAGGILEFVLLVAPPGLNQHSLWKEGAERAIAEITKRYKPAILMLKAYPMELMADRDAEWGPPRQAALRRLYARTLGVEDLEQEGLMWKRLRHRGPIEIWAEHAEAVSRRLLDADDDTAGEAAAADSRLLLCATDSRDWY